MRGKKSLDLKGILPEKITRRECASRVGELFDVTGRFTPLIAEFKLDLREHSTRKLDWDDYVPDELISNWKKKRRRLFN